MDVTNEAVPPWIATLLEGLADTQAGFCLCDAADVIQYANASFRAAFCPQLTDEPAEFSEAMAEAIKRGVGIQLTSMSLDEFVPKVRARRRLGDPRYNFTLDTSDGRWWMINDYRLDNGWTLVVATDISTVKLEELRLRDAHAEALKASQTDALTGIANRRSGLAHAEAALREFEVNRLSLCIAILDVDSFKGINDAYGHSCGDAVLVHFTAALGAKLAAHDHISRLGGEEFMVVMPDTPLDRAEGRLNRLIRTLGALSDCDGSGEIRYSFSAGITKARHGDDLRNLISRADQALYRAKAAGRGRVEVWRMADAQVA